MYRRPGHGGRSKASADTLCQKCLKRGHYSYECTASAQERPYKSRPSRTQQLLNPQLKPKLSTEVPNELLRKKGVADEILAKKEQERGRKTSRDRSKSSRKRSRSASIYSSDSVSTISTNRSLSKSLSPSRERNGTPFSGKGKDTKLGKRGRRSMSSSSMESDASRDGLRAAERHTRRRLSSFSPENRGRRRTRSRSSRMEMSHDNDYESRRGRGHRRLTRSRSHSRDKARPRLHSRNRDPHAKPIGPSSMDRSRSRSLDRMDTSEDHNTIRNGDTRVARGRWRASPLAGRWSRSRSRSWGVRRRGSRSRSPYRGRRIPSPPPNRRTMRSPSPYKAQNGTHRRNAPYGGREPPHEDKRPQHAARNGPPAQPAPQRERSLSPYSKRVAMTRAMQAG